MAQKKRIRSPGQQAASKGKSRGGVPPIEYRFKKGQSGNPLGSKLHNPITRALKKLTIETYREVIELVMSGNNAALEKMIKNPKTSALQVGIATAFQKAIKAGDYGVIERIAERIVGKIPDELNVNSKNLNANLISAIDPVKLKEAMATVEDDV
jgi:hypothetical protein